MCVESLCSEPFARFAFCDTGTSASPLACRRKPKAAPRLTPAAESVVQSLEARVLLSASLTSTVNPGTPVSQGPATSVTIGNEVYFAGNDGVHGVELWKSDGTSAGTVMVADINAGAGSSNPADLTNVEGELYFSANDGVHGTELWKSDGTAAGTSMAADINPGAGSSNPANITALDNLVYFSANDGTHGNGLWVTGGNMASPTRVQDSNSGAAVSNPSSLLADTTEIRSPAFLYFIATGSDGTRELWFTSAGNPAARQVTTGLTNVSDPVLFNSLVYFAADDGVHGTELWSGAYFQQAKMVDDIDPGAASSNPSGLYVFENQLYFSANFVPGDPQMWKTDGTAQNTTVFTGPAKFFGGTRFTPLYYVSRGDKLYIVNYDATFDTNELWETDGTNAGTTEITQNLSLDYYTPQVFATESEVYFIANGYNAPLDGLYKTDGTAAGTTLADPGEPAAGWSPIRILGATNNTLLFGAVSSGGYLSGEDLWGIPIPSAAAASFVKTDSTTQGTWEGVYGSQGFADPAQINPLSGIQLSTENATTFDWADNTSDPRALQVLNPRSATVVRDADCWYAYTPFSLDVNFTDGGTHQAALYLLDWDRLGRSETVRISDATNGNILSTQTVSNFQNGKWLLYNLSGDVKITFTNDGPVNAVVSGVFFDPVHTQAPGTATEVGANTTLGGNWLNTYGSGGYVVMGGATNLPASISYQTNGTPFVWAQNTSDPRAMTTGQGTTGNVAGCLYSYTSFNLDLSFNDGQAHQLALYLVDYDYRSRSETVQINDATTGALLDSQVVSNFGGGEYLVYNVSGQHQNHRHQRPRLAQRRAKRIVYRPGSGRAGDRPIHQDRLDDPGHLHRRLWQRRV